MKVLKSGTPGGAWSKEFECTGSANYKVGCGALLLLDGSDVFGGSKTHYDGSSSEWRAFMCPECGAFTDLESSDAPSNVGTRGPNEKEKAIYRRD